MEKWENFLPTNQKLLRPIFGCSLLGRFPKQFQVFLVPISEKKLLEFQNFVDFLVGRIKPNIQFLAKISERKLIFVQLFNVKLESIYYLNFLRIMVCLLKTHKFWSEIHLFFKLCCLGFFQWKFMQEDKKVEVGEPYHNPLKIVPGLPQRKLA